MKQPRMQHSITEYEAIGEIIKGQHNWQFCG